MKSVFAALIVAFGFSAAIATEHTTTTTEKASVEHKADGTEVEKHETTTETK